MTLAEIEEELAALLRRETPIPDDKLRVLSALIEAKKVHELTGIRGALWHLSNVKYEEQHPEP